MKILITGATGFIGTAVAKKLQSLGHHLVICVRDVAYASLLFPSATVISVDYTKASYSEFGPEFWLEKLSGIDVVINCVGVLNSKQQQSVHFETPKALFLACRKTHIRLIIQLSALGVENGKTLYAATKRAADEFLLSLDGPAVILRPSLVYANGSYGGTSLFRALASLPWRIPLVGTGTQLFQPIAMDELTQAIANIVTTTPDKPIVLNAIGLEQVSLAKLLKAFRAWLGFKAIKTISIPTFIIHLVCKIGNLFHSPVINSTAYQMLSQDNVVTDAELQKFQQYSQVSLKPFHENLFNQPSYVQDRWHARLYFLRPLLRLSISLTWIFSGIFSLISFSSSVSFLQFIPFVSKFATTTVIVTSLIDLVLGLCTLFNIFLKKISMLQISLIFFYTMIISIFIPALWLDPFGAVLKNIVFMVATLILIAISELR